MALRPRRPSAITARFERALGSVSRTPGRSLARIGAEGGPLPAVFAGVSQFADALLEEGIQERRTEALTAAETAGQLEATRAVIGGEAPTPREGSSDVDRAYNQALQAAYFTNLDLIVARRADGLMQQAKDDPAQFASRFDAISEGVLEQLPEDWRPAAQLELERRKLNGLAKVQQNFRKTTEAEANADLLTNATDYSARALNGYRTDAEDAEEWTIKYIGAVQARSDLTPQQKAQALVEFEQAQREQAVLGDFEAILAGPQPGDILGRTAKGRPIVLNEDGSVSTERTATVERDGKWFNIPTMFGGRQVSTAEAARRIFDAGGTDPETGRTLPAFATAEEAEASARERSERLGQEIGRLSRSPLVNAQRFIERFRNSDAVADPEERERIAKDMESRLEAQATMAAEGAVDTMLNGGATFTDIADRLNTGDVAGTPLATVISAEDMDHPLTSEARSAAFKALSARLTLDGKLRDLENDENEKALNDKKTLFYLATDPQQKRTLAASIIQNPAFDGDDTRKVLDELANQGFSTVSNQRVFVDLHTGLVTGERGIADIEANRAELRGEDFRALVSLARSTQNEALRENIAFMQNRLGIANVDNPTQEQMDLFEQSQDMVAELQQFVLETPDASPTAIRNKAQEVLSAGRMAVEKRRVERVKETIRNVGAQIPGFDPNDPRGSLDRAIEEGTVGADSLVLLQMQNALDQARRLGVQVGSGRQGTLQDRASEAGRFQAPLPGGER